MQARWAGLIKIERPFCEWRESRRLRRQMLRRFGHMPDLNRPMQPPSSNLPLGPLESDANRRYRSC